MADPGKTRLMRRGYKLWVPVLCRALCRGCRAGSPGLQSLPGVTLGSSSLAPAPVSVCFSLDPRSPCPSQDPVPSSHFWSLLLPLGPLLAVLRIHFQCMLAGAEMEAVPEVLRAVGLTEPWAGGFGPHPGHRQRSQILP